MRTLLFVALVFLGACSGSTEPADDTGAQPVVDPTWHRDIQPLVATHCQGCHVDGGGGPFALQTLDEVTLLSGAMQAAMDERRMPPWPADPDCGTFQNSRALDPADIETFRNWTALGHPEGEATGDPVPPPVVATITPTHSASVPGYVSSADSTDEYRCFVLDMDIPETRYLTATQVIAGSAQVHHVLVYALDEAQGDFVRQKDLEQEGAGYTCFGSPLDGQDFISLDTVTQGFPNQIGAWVPGLDPAVQPEGAAIRVNGGSTIVLQVHYSPLGGTPQEDHTEFQAVLTEDTPDILVRTVPLLIPEIDVAPGQADASFTAEFRNYNDRPIAVTSFTSHMHLLGSHQTTQVLRADASVPAECALDIPEWDFDWQLTYKRPHNEPVLLDPGDGLELTCGYDNSAANQPIIDGEAIEPQRVQWGDGTLDEMCILYLTTAEPYTPPPDPDEVACAGTDACVASCDEGDIECLMRCPAADADCAVCVLQNSFDCGMSLCGAGFLLDSDCITNCLITTLMFGGSTGECLAQQCTTQYDLFLDCAEPKVATGDCDPALTGCGYPLPAR